MCERFANPIYPISTTNEMINSIPFDFNDLVDNENSYFQLKTNSPTRFYFSRLILDLSPDYCFSEKDNLFTDKGNLIIQQFKAGPFDSTVKEQNTKDTYLHFRDIVIPIDIEFEYDPKVSPENMNLSIQTTNSTIQFKNYFATNGDNQDKVLVEMVHLNEFFKVKNSPFFQKVIDSILDQSQLSKQIKLELGRAISDYYESQNPRKNFIDKMERMKDMMDVIVK